MSSPDDWETSCPVRDDRTHCEHWYEGAACCSCGDPASPNVDQATGEATTSA